MVNLSKIPAKWKLNHIKYPVKKNTSNYTITKIENEDV